MANPQFYLREGGGYVRRFDERHELFTTFNTAYATIFTTDPRHPKCMLVSSPNFKGVEDYVSELIAGKKYVAEFAYLCSGSREIKFNIYDQVNGATILTASGLAQTAAWANYYNTFTTPANCSTLRLRFESVGGTKHFYIDDVKVQGNVLYRDPDGYGIDFPAVGHNHLLAGGNVVRDQVARHVGFTMNFPNITASAMTRMVRASRDRDAATFDDGNNITLTEYGTIYTSKVYKFTSLVKPGGSVHAAYKALTTANRPVASDAFESTELSTVEMRTLATDDANAVTVNVGEAGKYGYMKAYFKTSAFATSSQVKNFTVRLEGGANDKAALNADGVELWAWDGDQWVMLDRSWKASNMRLNFSTHNKEFARRFVDTDNQQIRLFCKTRYYKDTTASMILYGRYFHVAVNQNLSREVPLLNKAVASANGLVEVRNMTSKTNLVYEAGTNGYVLVDNRQGVRVTSDQAVSSLIRVKYRTYYEVAFEQLAEPTVYGGDVSDPRGVGAVRLETVKSIG